jgi:hypothetical protein
LQDPQKFTQFFKNIPSGNPVDQRKRCPTRTISGFTDDEPFKKHIRIKKVREDLQAAVRMGVKYSRVGTNIKKRISFLF